MRSTHGGKKQMSKPSHKEVTSIDFCVRLVSSAIVNDLIAHIKGGGKQLIAGGGKKFKNQFYKDLSFYINNVVDPLHDFKIHPGYKDTLSSNPRIIPYVNKTETEILTTLLHDQNVPHGICAKYTRFYETLNRDDNKSVWAQIDDGFNHLGGAHTLKYCVWNASIANTGTHDFDTSYAKIVPLSLRWDPIRSGPINFVVGKTQKESDNFYRND
jgi:hypothetical protein